MANFKRKKARRKCRCSLCTQLRWLGNAKRRKSIRDLRKLQDKDVMAS